MSRRRFEFFAVVAGLGCALAATVAHADEAELLRRIDAQNARIEKLERLIGDMMRDAEPETYAPAPQAAQATPEATPAPAAPPQPEVDDDPLGGGGGKKGYDPERAFGGALPRLTSKDGRYSLGFTGLMQYDLAAYSQNGQGNNDTTQSLAPDFNDGTKLRRAILGVNGVFLKDWIYAFSYDFASTGERVVDGLRAGLLIYRGLDPWWILVGQQGNRIGLDGSTFSSRRMFMEAANPAAIFGFSPGTPTLGVSTLHRGPHHMLRLALLGEPANTDGNSDEGWGLHGRFAWAPIAERTRTLHLGASGYWRKPDTLRGIDNAANTSTISFSDRPEVRVDDTRLLDTGLIPRVDDYWHVGVEAAVVYGPWSLQGEYGYTGLNRKNGPTEAAFQDLAFDGYYVQGSYFLTGESRNYYPRFGAFWRIKPHNDFSLSKGGWGAWEVAARYSHTNLDDGVDNLAGGGIRGGIGDNYTLGLNWYPNAFTRVLFNYIHIDVDNLSDTGLSEGTVVDVLALRMQVEW